MQTLCGGRSFGLNLCRNCPAMSVSSEPFRGLDFRSLRFQKYHSLNAAAYSGAGVNSMEIVVRETGHTVNVLKEWGSRIPESLPALSLSLAPHSHGHVLAERGAPMM